MSLNGLLWSCLVRGKPTRCVTMIPAALKTDRGTHMYLQGTLESRGDLPVGLHQNLSGPPLGSRCSQRLDVTLGLAPTAPVFCNIV